MDRTISLFNHSPSEGHLGCFQLSITDKAAINIHTQDCVQMLSFFIPLAKC